jgi:hypothetical protein
MPVASEANIPDKISSQASLVTCSGRKLHHEVLRRCFFENTPCFLAKNSVQLTKAQFRAPECCPQNGDAEVSVPFIDSAGAIGRQKSRERRSAWVHQHSLGTCPCAGSLGAPYSR